MGYLARLSATNGAHFRECPNKLGARSISGGDYIERVKEIDKKIEKQLERIKLADELSVQISELKEKQVLSVVAENPTDPRCLPLSVLEVSESVKDRLRKAYQISTLGELADLGKTKMHKIQWVNKKSVEQAEKCLTKHGLTLKD